ncbi:hypothetical protein GOODEAATRI_008427 [Goodea atripinnis]|uniref:Telomere-associated protein Rif1 N-terminal domain-containing protein n=1 Tax=Goodea atripinnis TaxID=208336 RepID=A0ABV0MI27_9TELE
MCSVSAGSKKERQGCEVLTLMLQALQSIVASEALSADKCLASQKSMLSSWSKLYRVFARCSALVVTAEENICCEELCVKMAAAVDREALMCLQVYLEAPEASPETTGSALVSVLSALLTNLVLGNAITEALNALIQPLMLFYKHAATETTKFSIHLEGKLEKLLCEVLGCLQSRSTLAYNNELLALLSPLLCVVFTHKNKHLRTAVTQFWNATFANTVSLEYPEEIRPVLSQVKQKTPIILPGFEAISVPDEFSETCSSESSQLETKLSGMPISSTGKRDSTLSKPELKDRRSTKTSKPVSTEEKSVEDAEILSKETQDNASPRDDEKTSELQPEEESISDSANVSLDDPTKSTGGTEDINMESKDSPSPNMSASSDLVSGTPQKPSSRRQSFITLEKYGEGKPASPSSVSSFIGPLVKTSTSQDLSSAKKILSSEASQTSIDPNSQVSTPLGKVGPQCPGSESPRRPKESRLKSEPVRLIERLQSDSAEDEDVIPDTQTKEEGREITSYSEEMNSLSQDEESEPVLDDSQSSLTPSDEPRRSSRHRVRPQLPGEDPEEREAKYTHVKRRSSGEDRKSESSNSAVSRPNTRSKLAAMENSTRDRLRSKSQSNSSESSPSNTRGRPRKKIKLYNLSEDLLKSPERKMRSISELNSSQTGIKSETLPIRQSQMQRRDDQISMASKEAGEAERAKEGSSQTVTEGMVNLTKEDDNHPNTDSQTVVPLAQTEQPEEVKPEDDESLKEEQKVLASSPQSKGKLQERIDSNAVMSSPMKKSKDETRKRLESENMMEDNINTIEAVTDSSSQEDSLVSPSSSGSQIKRRSRRSKALSEAAESEDKDNGVSSSGRSRCSQTLTLPVSQTEAVVGGRTRRSKPGESNPSLTPESSQSLDESGSGSSQGRGRYSRRRSSQSSAPCVETSESESSTVPENSVRKRRGRKPRAFVQSPPTLESKEERLDMEEAVSQKLETKNSLEESSETQSLKESEQVTGSKTEPNKEESESPMVTETLETEALKMDERKDTNQWNKSLGSTDQSDSNNKKDSSQEVGELESAGPGNASTQETCMSTEEKLQISETSEKKAETFSETEDKVIEKQVDLNSNQQEFSAPPEEECLNEELQQSQMECAQITAEEELSATCHVLESSAKEEIPLQDNKDFETETSGDKHKKAPDTEPSGDVGPDCSPAVSSQVASQESPVKQKDIEAATEPDVGQSPTNGRMRGTWSPSASPSTSILKKGQKRPIEVEMTSPFAKSRRVSFANPIQQQETADDIDRRSPALRTSSPRRSKGCSIPQPKAALALLREKGVRIFTYLTPSQQVSFLGLEICPDHQDASFRPQSGCFSPLPCLVSVWIQPAFPDYPTTDGYDGIYDPSSTIRPSEDAPVPTVDPHPPALWMRSPLHKDNDNHCLYVGSPPLVGTRTIVPWFTNRQSNLLQSSIHGRLPEGVGGSVRWRGSDGGLDTSSIYTLHSLPGALSTCAGSATCLPGSVRPTCSVQERQHHYGFTHKQRGKDSLASSPKSMVHPLAVVQRTLSIRATHKHLSHYANPDWLVIATPASPTL